MRVWAYGQRERGTGTLAFRMSGERVVRGLLSGVCAAMALLLLVVLVRLVRKVGKWCVEGDGVGS
jgi:hypothetical protein